LPLDPKKWIVDWEGYLLQTLTGWENLIKINPQVERLRELAFDVE